MRSPEGRAGQPGGGVGSRGWGGDWDNGQREGGRVVMPEEMNLGVTRCCGFWVRWYAGLYVTWCPSWASGRGMDFYFGISLISM